MKPFSLSLSSASCSTPRSSFSCPWCLWTLTSRPSAPPSSPSARWACPPPSAPPVTCSPTPSRSTGMRTTTCCTRASSPPPPPPSTSGGPTFSPPKTSPPGRGPPSPLLRWALGKDYCITGRANQISCAVGLR